MVIEEGIYGVEVIYRDARFARQLFYDLLEMAVNLRSLTVGTPVGDQVGVGGVKRLGPGDDAI